MKENIRNRVEKLHSKISRLKEHRKSLTEENRELHHKVYELTEQLYSSGNTNNNASWMSNIRRRVDLTNVNSPNAPEKQSAEVTKLMKGYRDAMEKWEVRFRELDEETTEDDMGAGIKRKYKMFKKWIDHNLPFSDDIQWAFLNFGVGISSFFSFYRFVVFNSCIMLLSYSYFLIKQLVEYNRGNESFSSFFAYGLPQFTMFSKVGESLANSYATAIILMMVCMTYSSFHKWIIENKKMIVNQLLTTNTTTNKFASLSFQCWNFSKCSKSEVYEQKMSVAEEFRLLLQDAELANIKQSRKSKEKYLLYARRTLGVVLNSSFVFGSWYAIFIIVSTQKQVVEKLAGVVGPAAASAMHPAGSIILVGLILPTVTFSITEFEQWETKIMTMKNQIWRLFFGRIANVVVAGIPPYVIYKCSLIGDSGSAASIIGVFEAPVDALTQSDGLDTETHAIFEGDYLCFEDVAAYYLLKLVLTDFFLPKAIKVGMWMAKEFVSRFKPMPHAPYNVAESIIEILYTQGLIWLTIPFYPFLAVLAPMMMVANFKFEKYVVSKFRGRMDASWKAEETGTFFIIFYNLTVLIGLMANYVFLQTEWPGYNEDAVYDEDTIDKASQQGPFSGTDLNPSTPWNAVEMWMSENSVGEVILNIFENATLFMTLAAILALKLALTGNMVEARRELLEHKDQEIGELCKKLMAQKRRLELQLEQKRWKKNKKDSGK